MCAARPPMPCLRMRPLSVAVTALLASGGASAWTGGPAADDSGSLVEFNDAFLQFGSDGSAVDISRFARANVALPGTYLADLHVNQAPSGQVEVVMQVMTPGHDAEPCIGEDLLGRLGIDMTRLSPEAMTRLREADAGACITLPELIADSTAVFDNGEQRLDIGVPQAALLRQARGYVDPSLWDDGIRAFRLQYNANAYRSGSGRDTATQAYAGINAGANAGPWRLRHIGNFNHHQHTGVRYQGIQTYLQRAVVPLKSQLTIGESFTDGTVFDSVGFRGIQLASDERMHPESQRGYAPTVHGIASSNARVQIRQGGNILYEANVAAGAFEIDDLYPSGYGGDLEVVVTEADGSVSISRVPYAAAVNALRPGVSRFSLTAGEYRHPSVDATPALLQATYQRGLGNRLTAYGGITASDEYAAAVAGAAFNTAIGAIGLDITRSRAGLPAQPDRGGQSLRLSYSKVIAPTRTNLTLAAYRYSSDDYLDLEDAVAINHRRPDDLLAEPDRERGRLQLSVNQDLPGGGGSFYLTGSRQDYWNRAQTQTQFQMGYNNAYGRITFGFSASRQFDLGRAAWDNRVIFTIGAALGRHPRAPYAQTTVQRDSLGATSLQQSLTGALGRDSAFSYAVNASRHRDGSARATGSLGANASYSLPSAIVSASASKSNRYNQAGAGISGGIVAYSGGVVLTPTMGDTLAIIRAKGARGATVPNGSGLRIDRWGHAVVSNLSPFTRSAIEVDPRGLPLHVQLNSSQEQTVPTAGAITLVKFDTTSAGRAAILHARRADGAPLPFGADVIDDSGRSVGTVAQAGRIVAGNLMSDDGTLHVRWGEAADEACALDYVLPAARRAKATHAVVNVLCE